MQAVAVESQEAMLESTQNVTEPLVKLLHTSVSLSINRRAKVMKVDAVEQPPFEQSVQSFMRVFTSFNQVFVQELQASFAHA